MKITALLIVVCGLSSAAPPPRASVQAIAKNASTPRPQVVVNSARDQIIPLLYDGGGWTTSFVIANLDNHTSLVDIRFYANDGSNLALPLNGVSSSTTAVEVTLPPGGNVSLVTSNFADTRTIGYAYISSPNGDLFGGYATVRNQTRNLPDLEFTVSYTTIDENYFTLAFDNSSGYATYVNLINSSSSNRASIAVTVEDSQGNVLATDKLAIDPYGRLSFNLADYYPAVNGLVGNVYFSAAGAQYVAGAGLRVGPNQSITAIPVLSLPPAVAK